MAKEYCSLFDFMAHRVGVKVLHPGGIGSTNLLLSELNLQKDSKVLDLACGTGSSSFLIYDKYQCHVTGVDISSELISIAQKDLQKRKDHPTIKFEVGDAFKLPFPDNSFDAVLSQAFFILVDDQQQARDEMLRVLKPQGCLGAIELSWHQTPHHEAYEELKALTCRDFIPRVKTVEQWNIFFKQKDMKVKTILEKKNDTGMMKMIKAEGLKNFLRIMFNMMKSIEVRKKMMTVQKTFEKYDNFLGYGVYCYEKL